MMTSAMTDSGFALVMQLLLGWIFLASAVGKLARPLDFALSLSQYGIVGAAAVPFASALIGVEIGLAFAHLTGWLLDVALSIGTVVLVGFALIVSRKLRRGDAVPCLCFGAGSSELISYYVLARLLLMLGAELVLLSLLLGGLQWTMPFELGLRAVLLATACAMASLLAVAWVLNLHRVVRTVSSK